MKDLNTNTQHYDFLNQFNLIANQVVEGFISGIHKSPFHGFSSEFSEHKMYNLGENTKNIDWKIYGKTEKLYVKKYDDETNLRCHIILDNSTSMHYPIVKSAIFPPQNKIQYASLAAAVLLKIIKKQRDAAGLTIFSNKIDFTIKEYGNEKHHRFLIEKLNEVYHSKQIKTTTNIIETLHEIATKIHKRSMIVIFSDMFQNNSINEHLLNALQHLKHNKHKIVLFHVYDKKTEFDFTFEDEAKKFVDVESGEAINLHTEQIQDMYTKLVKSHFENIQNICLQYKIDYQKIDIQEKLEKILTLYLTDKQIFK